MCVVVEDELSEGSQPVVQLLPSMRYWQPPSALVSQTSCSNQQWTLAQKNQILVNPAYRPALLVVCMCGVALHTSFSSKVLLGEESCMLYLTVLQYVETLYSLHWNLC